ncbi:MAG: septum formation initiator family protein [Gammaproteobacteria bacterium]|nr:septum formation initiator family protein [Gammaproteobacteria bacterium]MCP5459901.1 septum formation initiator family protein [Gammaproteobacteria bacterium]
MPGVTLSKSSATNLDTDTGRPTGRLDNVARAQNLSKLGQIIVIVALSIFLVALNDELWRFDNRGVQQVHHLRDAVQEQKEENARLDERNKALEAEVLSLKQGLDAMEELARTELGMIRKDETFFRVLEEPPAESPHTP